MRLSKILFWIFGLVCLSLPLWPAKADGPHCRAFEDQWNRAVAGKDRSATIAAKRRIEVARGSCPDLWERVVNKPLPPASQKKPESPAIPASKPDRDEREPSGSIQSLPKVAPDTTKLSTRQLLEKADAAALAERWSQARYFYVAGCEKGHSFACSRASELYEKGFPKPIDLASARKYIERSCDRPEREDCRQFARFLANGIGGAKDAPRAEKVFLDHCNASNHGTNRQSCADAGFVIYYAPNASEDDKARAVKLFRRGCLGSEDDGGMPGLAAAYGARNGCGAYGMALFYGLGGVDNKYVGLDYILKGCGLDADQFYCSEYDKNWKSVNHISHRNMLKYKELCASGNFEQCYRYGDFLASFQHGLFDSPGRYNDSIRSEGTAALEKACDSNVGGACFQIAENNWYRGGPSATDFSKNRSLYLKGCNLNHKKSCFRYGTLLNEEQGGARDIEGAKTYVKQACDSGDKEACDYRDRWKF